ncbi:transposase [Nocardia gipuzkoensis]
MRGGDGGAVVLGCRAEHVAHRPPRCVQPTAHNCHCAAPQNCCASVGTAAWNAETTELHRSRLRDRQILALTRESLAPTLHLLTASGFQGQSLAFCKSLRARWPGEKLYLICDNYSVHKRAEVRARCAANAVELVFLPTYSSWLNRIECEFAALRYFALNGTDHRSHGQQDDAIGTYVRWRNQHAGPVRDFAVGSKIRHPDYLPNVA